MKEIEKITRKNSKMTFEDYWKEYGDNINKDRRKKYDKKSKFSKFFFSRDDPILNSNIIKHTAKLFFGCGRLQMIAEINMENYNEKK